MVLGLTATSLTLQAQLRTGDIVWTPLPRAGAPADTAYRKGVSAAFAGLIGDHLVLAGGCNVPDRPAADGGAKRYYDDVYVLAPGTDGQAWIRAGHMPDAAAGRHSAVAFALCPTSPKSSRARRRAARM